MDGQLASVEEEPVLTEQCQALKMTLPVLMPIIKQIQMLASNTVCCASKMTDEEGDVLRVVAKDIQGLGSEIMTCLDEAHLLTNDLMVLVSRTVEASAFHNYQLIALLRQLDLALSPILITVRKGEYLAIYASLEAVHLSDGGGYIETMAAKLKVLMIQLQTHYKQQGIVLQDMIETVRPRQLKSI